MSRHQKIIGRFAVLAALFGFIASVGAVAQEESSVLVEQKAAPAIDGPELPPPTNQPTLPPPSTAATEPAADQPTEATVKRPFMRPAEPRRRTPASTALSVVEEPMPAPDERSNGIEVRPTPPIEYDTDGDARRMYRHSGEVELIMVTQDPADGCFYEIPLCIPACCTGEPIMSSGRGIFGRGVVEYCWPSCGFRAIVKFRHILGDVRVDYEGD